MIHEFRAVAASELGMLDVICTEPPISQHRRFPIERKFHTRFEMLARGDVKCLHCGERFFATRTGYEHDDTKTELPNG